MFGFYKKQFKLVHQAVSDGYYEDSNDTNDSNESDFNDDSPISDAREVSSSSSTSSESKQEVQNIIDMELDPSDEGQLVNVMNKLISIIESKGEKNEDLEKTALSKYTNTLKIIQLTYPDNKLIPFFSSKIQEWKDAKKKENKKQWIFILICLIGGPLLLLLLALCL